MKDRVGVDARFKKLHPAMAGSKRSLGCHMRSMYPEETNVQEATATPDLDVDWLWRRLVVLDVHSSVVWSEGVEACCHAICHGSC